MIHTIFVVLVFLPAIAIFFLIVSDILTVFVLPAFFRFPHTPLIEMHLGSGDLFKIVFMELLATILLAIIIVLCTKVLAYVERTAERLRKYAEKYKIETY
jgi:predicted Na+-dependent transporter